MSGAVKGRETIDLSSMGVRADKEMGREHLASLIDDMRRRGRETAVVEHRGVRHLRTSYGEIAELAGRFAAELRRREIVAGERVVLWGVSSAEWMGALFGCVLRGVIVVPLDSAGAREFVERVIADTQARRGSPTPRCRSRGCSALHRSHGWHWHSRQR